MCFSSKQPKAPIERPTYAPEDAHKHFTTTQETDPEPKAMEEEVPQASVRATGPKIKPTAGTIRM